MMMRLWSISQVNNFSVLREFLVTIHGKLDQRKVVQWSLTFVPNEIMENVFVSAVRIEQTTLWIYSKEKNFEYDLIYKKFIRELDDFTPLRLNGEFLLTEQKGTNRLAYYNHQQKNAIWERKLKLNLFEISHDEIFGIVMSENIEKKSIVAISLESGNQLWQFNLLKNNDWLTREGDEMICEFHRIIGISENILWTVLNSGVLLGIDIKSGEKKYELCQPNLFPKNYQIAEGFENVNIFNRNSFLDEKNNQIFGINGFYYWEIGLDKPEEQFTMYDIQDSCVENGLELNNLASWSGEQIWFFHGGKNNRFGVLSRKNKLIEWSGEIKEVANQFPSIRKMECTDDRIFIQDYFNTLHIFQKTT